MVAVHVVSSTTDDGAVTTAWQLSSGTSSALFAVLGGIGLAFMSGRTRRPTVPEWGRHGRRLALRGLLILLIGLLLGPVIPADSAGVILPYLGILFVLALPFLRLRSTPLFVLGALWAVAAPVLSHLLRAGRPVPEPTNLSFGDLFAAPGPSLEYLLVGGLYPVLTWFPYILVGLGLGRLDLSARRHALTISLAGAGLWLGATLTSWLALRWGAVERLAADESGRMWLEDLTGTLVWGGDGTAPASSWWWFASAAPHTGLPLDLFRTTGVALLVLGLCLAVAAVASRFLRPLAVPGSMTLTLYTVHLLLLITPLAELPGGVGYLVHVVLLVGLAFLWRRVARRGPLEGLVWWVASQVGRPPARHRSGRS